MSNNETGHVIILGPDGDDGVPMHWSSQVCDWVDSDSELATKYKSKEFYSIVPPWELPIGTQAIMDTGLDSMALIPPGGWVKGSINGQPPSPGEDSENKI